MFSTQSKVPILSLPRGSSAPRHKGYREKPGRGCRPEKVDDFLTSTPTSMANWDVPHHSGAAEGQGMVEQPGLGWSEPPVPPCPNSSGRWSRGPGSRPEGRYPACSLTRGDGRLAAPARPAGREPLPDAIFSLLTLRFLLDCLPAPEQSRAEHRRCLSCLAPDGM